MINLNSSTRIQAFLGGAVTTREINYFVTYADRVTATGVTSLAVTVISKSSGTSDVDICSAPAAGTIRAILGIIVANVDTAAVECTIQLEDGSDWPFTPFTISANRMAQFTKEGQWVEYSAGGGGGDALTTNPLSQFAATTSAQLRSVLTDETGSGAAMFGTQPVVTTDITIPNTGLHLLDTNASHDLIIAPGSDLTADRTFTLTTGDAARTLDISAASVTVSAFGATLVDDADAAAGRTTLGLGTIATQAANSVSITGGSITGITDLAVADGGTGASTAAGARLNLGAANTTLSWWYPFAPYNISGAAVGAVTTSAQAAAVDGGNDPDAHYAGRSAADGNRTEVQFEFPVPDQLDLTAIVTAKVYYRIHAAGTAAAVEIELTGREVANDELIASGGTQFDVAAAMSVNSYASADLVVHSLGTVFGANTISAEAWVKGVIFRDAQAGNADDTFAGTTTLIGVKFSGTRLTT